MPFDAIGGNGDMQRRRSRGFTLTEMLMAVVISVIVFGAMGTLLSRCFFLWLDGQAQWKLAQHARVTRLRLLNGAFGVGTGLLNSTNVTLGTWSGWTTVTFDPVTASGYFRIYGSPGTSQQNIWIEREVGSPSFAWAQQVTYSKAQNPDVLINNFSATVSNQVVRLSYTLNFLSMGRTNTLPQVIEAKLVNK